ncbi:MAG: phosphatidylglycerol lysyltransferase domain-containing protein, partial [Pseudomonadota bacterium]
RFFASHGRAYFDVGGYENLLLAYAYTGGANDYLASLEELQAICSEQALRLTVLTAQCLERVGDVAFSATPFGAVQRVGRLADFRLSGGKMRRLRYLYGKYERLGAQTREYRCGSQPETDQAIAAVIDRWKAERAMVNPLVDVARADMLAGTLSSEHRVFITSVGDRLDNLVLITPIAGDVNGYLMDLEFYPPDMPLGGLEFTIVKIIEQLVSEGCDTFSLGATFGPKLATVATADPQVDELLDQLRAQGVFNDAGNLQFKNKFRPDNEIIYLCRPKEAGHADDAMDLIMMIADPHRMGGTSALESLVARSASGAVAQPPAWAEANSQVGPPPVPAATVTPAATGADGRGVGGLPDQNLAVASSPMQGDSASEAHVPTATDAYEQRLCWLAESQYNVLKLASEQVDLDLKTDSWAEVRMPFIEHRSARLLSQVPLAGEPEPLLRGVFPFEHFVLVESGRTAERLLCAAWERPGRVLQHLLFPTWIFSELEHGFEPVELAVDAAVDAHSCRSDRAELDLERLTRELTDGEPPISFVCLELCNNAVGGLAVTVEHLEALRDRLRPHGVALVLDATRVLDNA